MLMIDGGLLDRWTELTDDDIVARVIDGQTALYELLMRRHNERVYRAARAILRDEAEAEDVMQQAYVNAYTHLRQFDRRASFATWLTRIAVNEALARARRQGRYVSMEREHDYPAESVGPTDTITPDPEMQTYAGELRVLLEAAVDALPDGAREVFVLREVQGLSTAETADVLGIREDAVKTRLSRAKLALRRDLLNRVGSVGSPAFAFHQSRCDRIVAAVFARIA
jgi:RNA polymerase sigma-70 factor (ECF subfamily)